MQDTKANQAKLNIKQNTSSRYELARVESLANDVNLAKIGFLFGVNLAFSLAILVRGVPLIMDIIARLKSQIFHLG